MTELRLEPMTPEQYQVYRKGAEADYAEQIAGSTGMSPADAARKSADDYARLLPDGLASPGQFLFTGYDGAAEVGMLWLRIEPRADGPHAFGFDFQVRPELRRRGYGRAIMLAAERECRVRGVASVGLNVFGRNLGAHSLYEQLGFEATAIQMTKRLSGPVETPGPGRPDERVQLAGSGAGVRLEPMTEAQYAVYLPFAQQDYARNIARSGAMSEAAAVEKAAEDFARRHSAGVDGDGGVDQPGRLLFTAYDGAAEVGMVGLRLEERTDGTYAFGFDFRVEPELRRRGYGRAIMLAAERVCRDRGVVSVGLSVFGFNRGAQSLYEQLGFEVSAIQMIKRL